MVSFDKLGTSLLTEDSLLIGHMRAICSQIPGVISVFYCTCNHSETEIKLFQPLKLFQQLWTCWKIFMSR